MTPAETIARLLAEWGPGKVRVYLGDGAYWTRNRVMTLDITKAGLFYPCDVLQIGALSSVHPVDPTTNPLDALVARLKWAELPVSHRSHLIRVADGHSPYGENRSGRMRADGLIEPEAESGRWQLTTLGQWLLEAGRV